MSATVTQSSLGTTAILPSSATTLGTYASTAGTSSQVGLCLTNPTVTYSTLTYGTGFKAATLLAIPVLFTGFAVFGVALLSYAVTKAAIEP